MTTGLSILHDAPHNASVTKIKERFDMCSTCGESKDKGFACRLYKKCCFGRWRANPDNQCPLGKWPAVKDKK